MFDLIIKVDFFDYGWQSCTYRIEMYVIHSPIPALKQTSPGTVRLDRGHLRRAAVCLVRLQ